MDPIFLSRLQFAATTVYHFFFVPYGKHTELLSQEGLYRQMWLAQNRLFREVSA